MFISEKVDFRKNNQFVQLVWDFPHFSTENHTSWEIAVQTGILVTLNLFKETKKGIYNVKYYKTQKRKSFY